MPEVTFRPITPADMPFLRELYGSTRAVELAQVPWTDEQKRAFIEHQFEAQHNHYQRVYPTGSFEVILCDGAPAGRLYMNRGSDEIRIIDITLSPEQRSKGIGSRLLQDVLAEATRANKPVRIHVENFNPAMNLYLRLGFRKISETGVYHFMEWVPDASKGGAQ